MRGLELSQRGCMEHSRSGRKVVARLVMIKKPYFVIIAVLDANAALAFRKSSDRRDAPYSASAFGV